MTAPAFSRSGTSSIFGKRTEDTRTRISAETKEALRRIWCELGYQTESEFLADLIEVRVHGLEHVRSVHIDRLSAVAGNGKGEGER